MSGHLVLPGQRSVRYSRRTLLVVSGLAVLGALVMIVTFSAGALGIPPAELPAVLAGEGSRIQNFTLISNRLPRALVAMGAGAALGVSGAIFQSVTRNPLGSPDIIGLNAGAAAGAALAVLVFPGLLPTPIAALLGAAAAIGMVFLATGRGFTAPLRMVVAGIGISAMALAVVNFAIARARVEDAQQLASWLNGSLTARLWPDVQTIAIGLTLLLPLALILSRGLQLVEMGDDAAVALGVNASRVRSAGVLVGVALAGVSVAVVGPVVFVALMAPQIARRLTRSTGPGMAAAAMTGAVIMVVSDLAAQWIVPDVRFPVGVLTAGIGGIYLAVLLVQEWRRGAL